MDCQGKWQEPPPDTGEDFDLPESPGRMKLLFVSFDGEEVVKAVKQLLFAFVRCLVSKEGTGWAVWVQDERDLPRALSIFKLWAKPRPLPAWAALLELDRPRPVKARAENTNGRRRCLRKQMETSRAGDA